MKSRSRRIGSLVAAALFVTITSPSVALAYIGPGLGLAGLGAALSLVGAVLLGVVGFIWYPVKRLLRVRRARREMTR